MTVQEHEGVLVDPVTWVAPDAGDDQVRGSREYLQAVVATAQDDACAEGLAVLDEQLQASTAQDAAYRSLYARREAAAAAMLFWAEQQVMLGEQMPPPVRRACELLAAWLGIGAVQARAFASVAPAAHQHLQRVSQRRDQLVGSGMYGAFPTVSSRPWVSHPPRPVEARDVAMLYVLGVDAVWDGRQVLATSSMDEVAALGYTAQREVPGGRVVGAAPDVLGWYAHH